MKLRTFVVEYDSNNSGGHWWLTNADWQKLEAAGWFVEWGGQDFCNPRYGSSGRRTAPDTHEPNECPGHRRDNSLEDAIKNDDKWLGCYAREARIDVEAYSSDLAEGVAKEWWQNTLGMNADEEGCNCCGRPHSFYARERAS